MKTANNANAKETVYVVTELGDDRIVAIFSEREKLRRWLAPFASGTWAVREREIDPTPKWPEGMTAFRVTRFYDESARIVVQKAEGPPEGIGRIHRDLNERWTELWAKDKKDALAQFHALFARAQTAKFKKDVRLC